MRRVRAAALLLVIVALLQLSSMRASHRSWQKDHTYRGFILIKDYFCFAYSIAEKSSRHARTLFFDRQIERVTGLAWDQAVNDTASLWQSIFWRALGPERAWQLYGIPAPVGEAGSGSLSVSCESSRSAG